MILALLSDIHANLEALDACLAHASRHGALRFAFLGDLVGYGADAAPVVERVMEHVSRGAIAVRGNHDDAIARSPRYMNEAALQAIERARDSLTAPQKAFLAGLPLSLREGAMCFVHASAAAPERWEYVDAESAALRSIGAAGTTYTFSGHVHEQWLFTDLGERRAAKHKPAPGTSIPLGRHRRWLALVGSVGQPRDGLPSAAYALFDTEVPALAFHRVAYDHLAAARKIRAAGLPEALAYRVERGV
ncbi:MAG: metallophosphoesterase family protein [Betaproteobacteria bacterium]|nr:metallophosphoesterase family protein [Betaproteobacteria bacterium]